MIRKKPKDLILAVLIFTILVFAIYLVKNINKPHNSFDDLENILYKKEPVKINDSYWKDIKINDPMTYSLILSAESEHYKLTRNKKSQSVANEYGNWIVEHKDENKNGITGYGLHIPSRDKKGRILPVGPEQTITNAFVIKGLLDWENAFDEAPRNKINNICEEIFNHAVSSKNNKFGFIMSTPFNESPDTPAINAAYMFVGQAQRFAETSANKDLSKKLIRWSREQMMALDKYKVEKKNRVYWPYSVTSSQQNDLVHAAYIVYGLFIYLKYGGDKTFTETLKLASNHLQDFYGDGFLYQYPMLNNSRLKNEKALLWGVGMDIYVLREMNNEILLDNSLHILKKYKSKDIYYYHNLSKKNIYLRDNAFVMQALAGLRNDN